MTAGGGSAGDEPGPDPPFLVHRYGEAASQFAELWLPAGEAWAPAGRGPVVALFHGGFWRVPWGTEQVQGLAADLCARGIAVWNVEYRRVGEPGGGWPGTFEDAARALDALPDAARAHGFVIGSLVVAGHSAGGHLALWCAARPGLPEGTPGAGPAVTPSLAVSLAGVSDVAECARRGLGEGAAVELLGRPEDHPERYALASPAARLPLRVDQLLVHGTEDLNVPVDQSDAYVRRARGAGDRCEYLRLDGVEHFALIDPCSAAWAAVAARLAGTPRL